MLKYLWICVSRISNEFKMLARLRRFIFRTKESTEEVLEQIEKSINKHEEYKRSTEQKQKHLVGSLIFYSIVIYIFSALFLYLYYFPKTLKQGVIYSIPLVVFPVIIWLVKRFLQWNFRRKLEYNDSELDELKRKKKAILEEVMEKETYKVATALLEKYDPEYKAKTNASKTIINTPTGATDAELRRRSLPSRGMAPSGLPLLNQRQSLPPSLPPQRNMNNAGQRRSPPVLPRPILPQERTVADRFIDFLVGDGPSNRYALICQQCHCHNGMALKEEFEFLSFRCCYCFYLNPARKEKPKAPKLEENGVQSSTESAQSKSVSSEVSDATEDEEIPDEEDSKELIGSDWENLKKGDGKTETKGAGDEEPT